MKIQSAINKLKSQKIEVIEKDSNKSFEKHCFEFGNSKTVMLVCNLTKRIVQFTTIVKLNGKVGRFYPKNLNESIEIHNYYL